MASYVSDADAEFQVLYTEFSKMIHKLKRDKRNTEFSFRVARFFLGMLKKYPGRPTLQTPTTHITLWGLSAISRALEISADLENHVLKIRDVLDQAKYTLDNSRRLFLPTTGIVDTDWYFYNKAMSDVISWTLRYLDALKMYEVVVDHVEIRVVGSDGWAEVDNKLAHPVARIVGEASTARRTDHSIAAIFRPGIPSSGISGTGQVTATGVRSN